MLAQFLNIAGIRRAESIWGEEFVHQSFSSFIYGACWRSISDDELVFLLPSLFRPRHAEDLSNELAHRIRNRVKHSIRAILQHPYLIKSTKADPWELVRRSEVATTFFHQEAIKKFNDEKSLPIRGAIVNMMCRLATMDRMLYDTRSSIDSFDLPLIQSVEFPDMLLSAIHTRINSAYVYPSAEYAHELLTAGAWLGTVLNGRRALLPVGIAETLLDYMDQRAPEHDQVEQRVQKIINCYADLVGGRDRLREAAQKTLMKGPQIFAPAHSATPATISESELWQPELSRYVNDFFRVIESANG